LNYPNIKANVGHPSLCPFSHLSPVPTATTPTGAWQCLMTDQPVLRSPPPYIPFPVVVAPLEFVSWSNLRFSPWIILFQISRKKRVFQHLINFHNKFFHVVTFAQCQSSLITIRRLFHDPGCFYNPSSYISMSFKAY